MFGDYLPNHAATQTWRAFFLERLREVALEEVLVPLRDTMLPLYQRAKLDGANWHDVETFTDPRFSERQPIVADLGRALIEWAESLHLSPAHFTGERTTRVTGTLWLLQTAVETLDAWSVGERALDRLEWATRGTIYSPPLSKEERTIQLGPFVWDIHKDRQKQHSLETEKRVLAQLKDEYDRIKAAFNTAIHNESGGQPRWVPRSKKQNPEQHFEWLIRWHVQGWTKKQLRERYFRGNQALDEGMDDAAELILLVRRRGRRGRPVIQG